MKDRLVLHIPYRIPTINHIYGRFGNRTYVKKEGKELQANVIKHIKKSKGNFKHKDEKLKVEMGICENWFTKKGTIKRKDIDNRIKFLQDCIFDALEIDDKYVWEIRCKKIQNDKEEKAVVKISKLKKIIK